MADEIKVTESELATALEGFYVRVRATGGAMGTCGAQLANAGETAAALYATLSRMAALREPHPTGSRTEDADLCARCGNQFKPGQVCDSCRDSDPELAAMAAIVTVMDRLDGEAVLLGEDVHERVIRWAMARWNVRA